MRVWILRIEDADMFGVDEYSVFTTFEKAEAAAWNFVVKDMRLCPEGDFKDVCCDEYKEGEHFYCREVFECYPTEFCTELIN